ncbi:unnamed protein product [Prorocentrum cordatum]|uniref:AD domain-containing protein n=1 Tax=Prorocentrum cordatum TaxID=2364126 RepID=A0ABN9TU00_9DINO|nr:unnamed protein product [Polarella glacialis]|mmetsp:Transcript_2592/g.6775  ORF Transcript_2592/g.6775 Transcript_2592/m.6775 type:complete len:183 (+) Transcript_2592:107-655(+)
MSASPRITDSIVGAQVRIVNTFGEEIEGELFCIDGGSSSLVICQRKENGTANYKWTKQSIVREVHVLSLPAPGGEELLPHVDIKQAASRADKLEAEERERVKRYGVGVSEKAQQVFDALAKTNEAAWDGQDIYLQVLGVKVTPPYDDPRRCVTGGKDEARERVQKVLSKLLEQLAAKRPWPK